MSKSSEQLLTEIGTVLLAQPNDRAIPALIVVVARVLIIDANGDMGELEKKFQKFTSLVHGAMTDMILQDLDDAQEAVKQ